MTGPSARITIRMPSGPSVQERMGLEYEARRQRMNVPALIQDLLERDPVIAARAAAVIAQAGHEFFERSHQPGRPMAEVRAQRRAETGGPSAHTTEIQTITIDRSTTP